MEQIPVIKTRGDLWEFCNAMQTEKKEEVPFVYKGKQYKAVRHNCFIFEEESEGEFGFLIPDGECANYGEGYGDFWGEEFEDLNL